MRVGIAGLWHETNTYAARPATLEAFEAFELTRGAEVLERHAGTGTVIGGFLERLDGCEPVGLLSAGAWPCGPAPAADLERLLEDLDDALAGAGVLDGVLVNLHGAMVAEGCDDVELAQLRVIRERVGDRPLAAVLDMHGNPSPEAVALCDAIVAYDTYPHVDMRARGAEAAALLRAALGGRELRCAVAKTGMLTCPLAQATDAEPMRSLHARARENAAREPGLERISLLPGFPYSDVARAGFSAVAVGDDPAAAASAAAALVQAAAERRAAFTLDRPGPAEAVERALRGRPPVVLADVADNVGGGAPGDGTALLAELLRQRAKGAIVQIADPEVAHRAARLGVGARLDADVGGKADRRHGEPVRLGARVVSVGRGDFTSTGSWMTGQRFTLGTTAVLDASGVTVVVTEHAVPPFHADALASLGLDPAGARIVVVKGAVAWRAAFGQLAGDVIEVDTPGICPIDVARLERRTTPASFDPRVRA